MAIILSLLSVVIISLISFVGALTLFFRGEALSRWLFILVGLAVGALLGDVFVHMIPEMYEATSSPLTISFGIIAGILLFFVLEKVLHWHHHAEGHAGSVPRPVGKIVLIGDGVHNFIDGLVIAGAYLISTEVGIATTIAVVLHEIPQEIGNFGVLVQAGYSRGKALWYNFLSALTSIAGALLAFAIGESATLLETFLLPLTAGSFIYIALSDLIPELHREQGIRRTLIQIVSIVIGVLAMIALLSLE